MNELSKMKSKKVRAVMFFVTVVIALALLSIGCQKASAAAETSAISKTVEEEGKEGAPTVAVGEAAFPVWVEGSDKTFNEQIRKIIKDKGLETVKIAFTNPYMSEYYNEIYAGAYTMMRELQDLYGIRFEYVQSSGMTHSDAETQIAAIRTWAEEGYHAVVVCTSAEASAMDEVFKEVLEKGMYPYYFNMPPRQLALNSDAPLNFTKGMMYGRAIVGYDNFLAHYDCGHWIAEVLTMKYGEPRGKVGLVWGPGGHWSVERENGLRAALAEYPDIQIVDKTYGVYDRDSGVKGADDLLTKYPDIDVLYGENEEMGLGAAQAVLARGLKLWDFDTKEGIITIGADGLVSGMEEIRAGRMTATINVNPVKNGRNLIEAVFWDRVVGWRIPKVILEPTTVVDIRNVDLNESYVKWALSVEYPSGGYK